MVSINLIQTNGLLIDNETTTKHSASAAARQNAKLLKRVIIPCFLAFFISFLFSATGTVVMCTEIHNDSIVSSSVLSINSTAFKWWKTPPLDFELRIHLFNYTNADRYMKGLDEKLTIEDLGPYVYVEKYEKVNVIFNENKTVSYQVNRSYQFLPEKSKGHEEDKIIVPNIILFYLSSQLRSQSPLLQLLFSTQLNGSTPFKTLTAHEFIWGYEESILKIFGSRENDSDALMDDKYGLFMKINRTSPDVLTIFTGEDDLSKLSITDTFNGEQKLNYWSTDECNKIDGTDGSQFPPDWVDRKRPLQVFAKGLCRKLPFIYDKEVETFKNMSVWRYKMPLNVFAHPDNNTANECYCDKKTGECSPSGIFNVSLCYDGPMFLSLPHFFTGDQSLFKNIEGLLPDESKHSSFLDVYPGSGISISGVSRFQINVQVQGGNGLEALIPMTDGQYLPILWTEIAPAEFTDEIHEEFKILFS